MLKSALKLILFLFLFFILLFLSRSEAKALSCSGTQEYCQSCEVPGSCRPSDCHDVTSTCCSNGCWTEFGYSECYSQTCDTCTYTVCGETCDSYSCPPCITDYYNYTCPDDGSTCNGNGGCNAPPLTGASGGGTNPQITEAPPTPTPDSCSNQSVCPEGQNVVCSGNACQSGTSCWCADPLAPTSSGAGNCSSAANCSGTAPCPIGLSGSWYCNSGSCQSFCEPGGSGAAPPPDTTPTPPPGSTLTSTPPPGCTTSSPANPVLTSPANNSTLGNLSVTFTWEGVSSWGENCTLGTAGYTVYADTNANPGTTVCTAPAGTTTCSANLTDQTIYKWKVVADNGQKKSSSPIWTFTLKQPVIQGTLYEDTNENGCYNSASSEIPVVNPNTITVSVNGQASYCTKTAITYSCTVPGSNTPGQTTVVNLSTTGYSPPYTAQTNCAVGNNASCAVNNCALNVSPGANTEVNIGFTTKQWFQTNSCTIYSGGLIASNIPTNAQDYDTAASVLKYFVLGDAGPVLTSSSLPHDFGSSGGTASQPNTKEINYPAITVQDYNFFKQKVGTRGKQIGSGGNLSLSAGKLIDGAINYPITNNSVWDITGNLNISDSLSLNAVNSSIIVSGNITFNGNFTPPNSNFAFISHGNISVDPAVSQINGLLLSDGQFSSGVTVNQGLKIVGSVAASNGFVLGRKWQNYKPAEYFVCDASAFVNLIPVLGLSSHTWTEIAP